MIPLFFVQVKGLKTLKTLNLSRNGNNLKFPGSGENYSDDTAGYQVVNNKVRYMFMLSTKEGYLLFLLVCVLGFIVYFFFYPLNILALFASLYKPKQKPRKEIMAVPVVPKISIEFNGNENSKFINDMKTMLENLVAENDAIYSLRSATLQREPVDPKDPFIPEDDEMDPDLDIEDDDGPELHEDQSPEDTSDSGVTDVSRASSEPKSYIELKDLI